MHIFDYSYLKDSLLPAQLVNLTSNIAALRVLSAERHARFDHAYSELERIAKIESVKASNAIEGIITMDARLKELMQDGTAPLNHTEAEISGYRDALNEIHLNHPFHDFTEREILAFYGQLTHCAAAETPEAMKQLVLAYQEARDDAEINKLLLIPCVILDFLCIHPFADGNGRLSRLLTLLLLYRNGFDAGKYISFEQRINEDKLAYYAALRESSEGWMTNENRPFPFMINFLMTLYGCYQELDRRFAVVNSGRVTKTARIESIVLNALTPIAKSDICRALPDVSPTTVEAVLGAMVRNGKIRKVGEGRGVRYVRCG